MAGRPLQDLLRRLRRAAAPTGGATDADLLGRFADGRDEAAFEALVWRHGPLVYGVCRRVLGHAEDAEDAFQAAFLVLARKAGAVRRRSAVGPWLYRVAQRVALRARRRLPAGPLPDDLAGPTRPDAAEGRDLRRVLDEEVGRLPARYRAAVVLRYLEGRTTDEAAVVLGCPPGTVLSRLAWARRRLRVRLAARGAALPAALAAVAGGEAAGAVPARWVAAAVGAAGAFAAGGRSGRPAALAAEVLRAMLMTRLRVGAVVVFGALAAGTALLLPGTTPGRVDGADKDKAAPQPVEVTVARPTRRTAGETLEFTGRTDASATVQVRPRVTGTVDKVAFQAGARVKRGDLLFELDPRTYQAELTKAQAEVLRAESQVKAAEVSAARLQRIRELGQVAAEEIDKAKSAVDEARANLMVAKAGLDRAKLDLDATRVTAPIDGQTGRPLLDVGNLAGPTTTLVTIVATDPMYVYFDVDERSLLRLRKAVRGGAAAAVQIGLSHQEGFPHRGAIDFVDNRADPATGTVRVRAKFPNPDGDLLPGMFARVRLTAGEPREELLVPQAAVRTDGGRPYVLVVGKDNAIEWRPVALGPQADGKRVVTAGVGPDDRVIVGGTADVAPGAAIRVREAGGGK
ncbi:MAG TPA: efflux RND transporter periplasmic adaptor subunit [Gemmataceae bacterium]|jgi:RND family efflux transporter MFP subunit